MSFIPLRLGPLSAKGYTILRSGVRWLREDGQMCRAHQPIGYVNITLEPTGTRVGGLPLLAEERELQIAFAPRVAGRLKLDGQLARGGYLSVRTIETWDPETAIGSIETDADAGGPEASDLRLLFLAGRRMTALADVTAGLLPGWHNRSRGWWCDANETPQTLLCLGVCDAYGVIRGAQGAFLEMFEEAGAAAQMVYVPDHPVAPCVPILLDQLDRTPAQFEAIAHDIHRHFANAPKPLTPEDWIFIGAMLTELGSTPLADRYDIISANGIQRLGPANAVLLSLVVEPQSILRHRALGYHVHFMRHHQAAAGPAIRSWIASAFEPVKRSVDSIRQDYEALIGKLQRRSGTRIMALNRMSSSAHEDISCYLGFDLPLGDTLTNVAAKEMNLMLQDIASSRPLDIIDVDAIAAELGGAEHLPDGIHQSGTMQAILRHEIMHAMSGLRQSPVRRPLVAELT